MKPSDEFWMQKCLSLAQMGAGKVSPNPLVGAVIVKQGKKIGEGFHEKYGGAHAEINALDDALRNGSDLRGSTMYINLEPCFHYGQTPPCLNAILKYEFSRIVIAMKDPNPSVAGKSIKEFRRNKIRCTVGILQKEAGYLNEKFIKYISTGIPFVALKAAQTSDGFIAREDGSSQWITNKKSRLYVHRLRGEYDAVLVGANTVLCDDPELTVRHIKGRNPVRIIVDGNFSIRANRKVLNGKADTILFASREAISRNKGKEAQFKKNGISIIVSPSKTGKLNIKDVLIELGKRKVSSVLVEGGQQMYYVFLKERVVNKIFLFTSKKKFGKGLKTFEHGIQKSSWTVERKSKFGTDLLEEVYIY